MHVMLTRVCHEQDALSGHTLGFAFVEYATAEIAEEVVAKSTKQARSFNVVLY